MGKDNSTKKRWRIKGSFRKSKGASSKNLEEDADTTATAPLSGRFSLSSPDSSTGSQDSSHKNALVVNDLPHAMSDNESDDTSDHEDLYTDEVHNDNDVSPVQPLHPLTDDDGEFSSEEDDNYCPFLKQKKPMVWNNTRESNNPEENELDSSNSSYEEEMTRHRMQRRNSPHFPASLDKIAEDSYENDEPLSPQQQGQTKAVNISDANSMPAAPVYAKAMTPAQQETRTMKMAQPTMMNSIQNPNKLPSHKELSKELCKIVATGHYSGQESLIALENLSKWAHTQDTALLKHFLTYGGVVKVIDFLDEQIEENYCKPSPNGDIIMEPNYKWDFLMESIHKTADVLCNVCFVGKHGINEDIAVVNATVVVKYGGIQSLVRGSGAYNRFDKQRDPTALKATEGVWNAIMNIYCNAQTAITKSISKLVMDAAIETLGVLSEIDDPIAVETLANVYNSLYRITYHDHVTKEEIQEKNLLHHCLNVYSKRRVTNCEADEELLEETISFLYGCHEKSLFEKGQDYEKCLPLCVLGLREFAFENDNIREWASHLLDGCCANIEKKEMLTSAEGAIEALAPFLTSREVDAEEKQFLRKLIRKIVTTTAFVPT